MGNSGSTSGDSRKTRSFPNSPEVHRFPSSYNKQSYVNVAGGRSSCDTGIPIPASTLATRRFLSEKPKPNAVTTYQAQIAEKQGNTELGSANSSRSASPSQQQNSSSLIPQPKSQISGNKHPPISSASSPSGSVCKVNGLKTQSSSSSFVPVQPNKNSVLDKLKLFNTREKNEDRGKVGLGVSKRTSSSSGISSARSEYSDSSASLHDRSKVQPESPKNRALKSKVQPTKAMKQANQKTAKKEQAKGQSKIVRTKATSDKLTTNTMALDDVRSSTRSTNAGIKIVTSRKPPHAQEQGKQPPHPPQLQKSHPPILSDTKQYNLMDTKNFITMKDDVSKQVNKTKVSVSGKPPDPKLQVQRIKVPLNGFNKNLVLQKRLISNPNEPGRHSDHHQVMTEVTSRNHEEFGSTLSMHQTGTLEKQLFIGKQKEVQECMKSNHIDVGESARYLSKPHGSPSKDASCTKLHARDLSGKQSPNYLHRVNTKQTTELKTIDLSNESPCHRPSHSSTTLLQSQSDALRGETDRQEAGANSSSHAFATCTSIISQTSSIPKPTAMVKGTSKPSKETNISNVPTATKLKVDVVNRKIDPSTVAMVSPMPIISDLMSESSHSNSNSTGPSNSSDSSVIYRPSSESGSEIKTIPNRKIDTSFDQMEKIMSGNAACGSGSIMDEDAEMTIKPMQPLMHGYTPSSRHLQTLPSRTTTRQYPVSHSSSHHNVGHDYTEIDASGYMSDGEVQSGGINVTNKMHFDLCDGYMSEGGASLYARKVNAPFARNQSRFISSSRQELLGAKELPVTRRIQKRPSCSNARRLDANAAKISGSDTVSGSNLPSSSATGSKTLTETIIEDLASISTGNHISTNHSAHSSHSKKLPGSGDVIVGGGKLATPQSAQQGNNLVYRMVNPRLPSGGHHPHVKKSDSSQQTDNSVFKHQHQQQTSNNILNNSSNSHQWKKYIEAGAARDREKDKESGPSSPSSCRRSQDKHRKQVMAEYANGEKHQKSSSGGTSAGSNNSGGKVRGVPQSFGYVKRHSAGTTPNPGGVQNDSKDTARTAQVSAVPRTKVKVSGGTQTCTTELQANSSSNQGHHYKSYSLTGPSASQLSQSVRDRIMLGSQSLPKPGSPEFTALFATAQHRERGVGGMSSNLSFTPRVLKPSDGSLSDTCSNYGTPDFQGYYSPSNLYNTSWMRHSNTYTPTGRSQGMGLCEADSAESLGSHRASLTHARLLMHQRDSTGSPAPPRLNRSNSIRSTKSEKMYPSMRGSGTSSSVGEDTGLGIGLGANVEPYYSVPVGSAGCTGQHWSQPTSPTPTHSSRQQHTLYQHVHKDDDIHGSSASLVSTASSLYSSAEEKQAHELRKLRRELLDAQEKVHSLTNQLSTNAHVVSAFEQSLSNMTQRLQQLTATAEKKDSELQELRETIEKLRKQSTEAGLNSAAATNNGRRHTLGDSDSSIMSCTGGHNHHQQGTSMARQLSADSVSSLNSLSSSCSASSHQKKKGWLRSSFSKAFSRSRKTRHGSVSDAEDCKENAGGELSAPNSPRLPTSVKHENARPQAKRTNNEQESPEYENPLSSSKSSSALYKKEDEDVIELKKQLREKDLVLTDIRLEALSSAHQLESLKDTVIKMRNEMLNLKQNNERLQRLVTSKSLTSSQSSLPSDPDRRFSMTEVPSTVSAVSNSDENSAPTQLEDLSVPDHAMVPASSTSTCDQISEQDNDGKKINVAVYLGSEKSFNYNVVAGNSSDIAVSEPPHSVIATICISNKTTWDTLDSTLRRCFKEYVSRIDPVTNLGLGVECVAAYHLGEASRCTTDSHHPELLPCGYLVGHVKTIYLVLSGYSWLAVDTLIPRSIVQRLISLLTEHRRVILCGPSGTGKSYLAGKLAHALVDADNEIKDGTAVATFNVDHKSSKELKQYLAHIAERCDSNTSDELPRVIILENLQHAASLGELFSGLLGTKHLSCPAIIGTMNQATCSTTNLQLHHNFRWVLCANHMEPVKGFLGRYLRRKLLEHELRETGVPRNAEMAAVVEWLPRVWLNLNKFLEMHSSSDVTIGPRLFLSCPMEVAGSQIWFTDLWNYSVIPYLVEAVREGLTLYGRRINGNENGDSFWEDPTQFITSSYPWTSNHVVHGGSDALLRLRAEDVGYGVSSGHNTGMTAPSMKSLGSNHSDTEGDPLLNMLMKLQEAANYSSAHSNDSDSVTSVDSSHTRHSEDLNTASSRGVESTL